MIDEKQLQEAIDRSAITNLISKSIIIRDSGRWDELAECYHSEAEFTSSWWKGKPSDFFKVASERLEESRRAGGEQKHVTSNQWVEIAGERATAESDLILFMRSMINGVALDFTTWSRRLQLIAKEKGAWKIYRRWVIYERDRMDPVDPTVAVDAYYDEAALAKYPKQLSFHLWRNEMLDSPTEWHIVLKGTPEETAARAQVACERLTTLRPCTDQQFSANSRFLRAAATKLTDLSNEPGSLRSSKGERDCRTGSCAAPAE